MLTGTLTLLKNGYVFRERSSEKICIPIFCLYNFFVNPS